MDAEKPTFTSIITLEGLKSAFGMGEAKEQPHAESGNKKETGFLGNTSFMSMWTIPNQQPAQIPSTERRSRRVGSFEFKKGDFEFKKGDIRGNIQKLLNRAESPDYFTAAGGAKVPEIKRMTVEQIGKKYGNKALGRYQIQYDTAIEELNRVGIKPSEFIFDEKGQDKIFDLLLKRRGKIAEYRAGKITREEVAQNLSTIWAGLPKDASGKSRYEKVGKNKAHVAWDDVLLALD